jgi:hypothetical protein
VRAHIFVCLLAYYVEWHLREAATRTFEDGTPAHSFATLMAELSTNVRNTCRTPHTGPDAPTFEVVTTPNAKQRRALELIQQIQV